ncbi:cytochrome c oxidase subunit I [Horticoccus luteus]|uniref:Cytochrome c oxidase subunit 1 n=1 Tax=Horticoccus luteus TaxID=2862869 RepID=A0A8F9XKP5_9BACT|nr:cytochrome c oxidase subunit I [Horticoccus luteus]QYM78264.1 cytochrome c oxidase subunit I [Horticoccus luteus]
MNEVASALDRAGLLTAAEREHWKIAWLSTVDHKRIGILYLVTALFFFVVGGVEALLIRLQLATPVSSLLAPDTYNMLFTMHGTTMIFLVAMPALFGLANYVVPLQIGARDMAFPRLNAFSFWLVPFGGILLHFSFLTGGAPAVGWFAYAPLSETPYSPQLGVDYWALALLVLGIGSVGTSINLLVTVLSRRAPHMTLRRLPLFSWMILVNSFLVIIALPVLNAGLAMLLIDRQLGGHFFLPSGGGSAIMWQHIFWAFGHPEVYIVAVPAFGILSEIIPVFSRKPIFGYEFVAGSTVAIAFLSLLVWAHHMFTVGLGHAVDLFFVASSMLIAIPTGIKVLAWAATMLGGRIRLDTPMLFCVAALAQFLLAGLTGVSLAVAALDWQTKNSYYLVAHFHFVFVGLIVFAILGALHYWVPKMSGRMLSERIGKWTFWLMVAGFNLTFIPQHLLGLAGMPRRVFTYPDLPGWEGMNLLSTFGAFLMAAAAILLVWNLGVSLLRGKLAGDNPWQAWTLEWATTSPPPHENFHALPPIRSRRPLWDVANPDRPDPPVGTRGKTDAMAPEKNRTSIIAFIISETGFFGVLILAFLFYNAIPQPGPGPADLKLLKTGFFTLCLLASSLTLWRAEVSEQRGQPRKLAVWLGTTLVLGGVFIVGQAWEYWDLFHHGARVDSNLFATTFFTLTGFHGLHVCVGLIALLVVLWLAMAGDFRRRHSPALKAVGLYWHFVDAVWVVVFTVVYLLPRFR